MRRRLDLAATLVGRPEVLFLDEPTTGLDPRGRNELWSVLDSLVDRGTTVILTTQYLEEAERLADDIVVIDHGRVIARGDAATLKRQVGGNHLHLALADGTDVERANRILGNVLGAEPERRHRHPDRHRADHPRRRGADRRRRRARPTPASRSTTSVSASPPSTRCSSPSPARPHIGGDGFADPLTEEATA